jgi:hypothetical protein
VTDRIEPIGSRRDMSPVERVLLTPVEREQRRRRREEQRRRRRPHTAPTPAEGADGDAPPGLDLRA